MEKSQSMETLQSNLLPDFQREIPTRKEARKLAMQAINNRALLIVRAREFGLNPDFLRMQNFLVGPFVSPAPLSTTFAGNINNFRTSVQVGRDLVDELQAAGQAAQQNMVVNLAMTEIPRKGNEAMDCLIVPKNKTMNQRLFLYGNPYRGQLYKNLELGSNDISNLQRQLRDSYTIYTERQPQLKRQGIGKILPESIFADMMNAFVAAQDQKTDGNAGYLLFAANLNQIMAKRIVPNQELPITCVDTTVYSPFFRNGINNIGTFTRKLQSLGFFIDNPGFLKIVDRNNKSLVLQLADIKNNDIRLKFRDFSESVSFSELQTSGTDISACKELTYMLTMANIFPVIYGSENSGGYYSPYAVAQDRIKRLGFTPTMYRVQPQVPEGYEQRQTVFDFYQQALLGEIA